jgi:hypothetical protein
MRLVILTASILALGFLVLLGLVHLVREMLGKDFFHPPSMPAETAKLDHGIERQSSSHSANPTT